MEEIVLLYQITIQLLGAFFAVVIARESKNLLLLAGPAFAGLMLLRRVSALVLQRDLIDWPIVATIDRQILPALISTLLLIFLYGVYQLVSELRQDKKGV